MTVNSRSFCFSRGNPVLELGCGSGDRLVAFEPSYGVDFCSTTVARAKHAILGSTSSGEVEDPATLIEGPFDYIVIADTIGLLWTAWMVFGQRRARCRPGCIWRIILRG
jgi:cyclopropane fatty-acyl-phospholipid synthase-like methyltransferase